MPASRPNILFIVVDDCGYADLGCTGQTHYRTPALDRLAAEGIRFTQAYANSALCTNTRVALITGRFEIKDLAGVRLIFYTNADADRFLTTSRAYSAIVAPFVSRASRRMISI
jgi:hypothetical protein